MEKNEMKDTKRATIVLDVLENLGKHINDQISGKLLRENLAENVEAFCMLVDSSNGLRG